MTEVFNTVFYSFWTFIGTVILISAILRGIAAIIHGVKKEDDE